MLRYCVVRLCDFIITQSYLLTAKSRLISSNNFGRVHEVWQMNRQRKTKTVDVGLEFSVKICTANCGQTCTDSGMVIIKRAYRNSTTLYPTVAYCVREMSTIPPLAVVRSAEEWDIMWTCLFFALSVSVCWLGNSKRCERILMEFCGAEGLFTF